MYRAILLIAIVTATGKPAAEPVRIAAAADTQRALQDVAAEFHRQGGSVEFSFGSTGLLARQIEQGAPFDLFVAADERHIHDLELKGKIRSGSASLYALGRLAIWTAPGRARVATLGDLMNTRFAHVAIADPAHAPYGAAAEQALRKAGIWERLQPRLVYGENVQQALRYAESGAADAAVVSYSLVASSRGRAVLVPQALYSPLRQAAAIPSAAPHPEAARRFLELLTGQAGRAILARHGFQLPSVQRRTQAPKAR